LRRLKQDKDLGKETLKRGIRTLLIFFAKANQRKRKKCINSLEEDGVKYEDNEDMIKHATEFYKKLFGKEPKENIELDENFWDDDEKVTQEENLILEAELTEEEIKKVPLMAPMLRVPQALMDFHLCSIRDSGRQSKGILCPW
jgi:hypothetical protein